MFMHMSCLGTFHKSCSCTFPVLAHSTSHVHAHVLSWHIPQVMFMHMSCLGTFHKSCSCTCPVLAHSTSHVHVLAHFTSHVHAHVLSWHIPQVMFMHMSCLGTFHNNEEVEMALCQCLQSKIPISTATTFLNLCQNAANASKWSDIMFINNSTSAG
jgi:hypothetical protein